MSSGQPPCRKNRAQIHGMALGSGQALTSSPLQGSPNPAVSQAPLLAALSRSLTREVGDLSHPINEKSERILLSSLHPSKQKLQPMVPTQSL